MRPVVARRPWRGATDSRLRQSTYFVFSLFALVTCWLTCFIIVAIRWNDGFHHMSKIPVGKEDSTVVVTRNTLRQRQDLPIILQQEQALRPRILSRSKTVVATADVRGNLGPPSVLIQHVPGKDWIHDRWQAASNMHGKAIPGAHWVQLDFHDTIVVDKVVLDWEAAYADQYILEALLEPWVENATTTTSSSSFWTLFDGTNPNEQHLRTVHEYGQSPGVTGKTPLHIVHTITPIANKKPFRYFRVHILKSKMGWGVSLWQVDVYGLYASEVMQ